MIYQELNVSAFRDAFIRMDRNVFSYKGYEALFDYLDNIGEDYELDVVALCGEFSELTYDEVRQNYDLNPEMSDDEVLDWLEDQTNVVYAWNSAVLFGVF